MPVSQPCNICGGTEFLPGFNGRMTDGRGPLCAKCRSVERHRAIRIIYEPLRPILKDWRALQFAPDLSVEKAWFKEYVSSSYGGHNSMNIMETGLDDDCFDLAIANHVLEHVSDDIRAVAELLRVVGRLGVVHLNVPSPIFRWETLDWGFADPERNLHFRDYGADFPQRVVHALHGLSCASVAAYDPVTGVADLTYFFSRSPGTLAAMGRLWARHRLAVTRLFDERV
jgi:SAM-dependent methyltransferase